MTNEERQQLIEHWMLLAQTVFAAEDNISDEWKPKLEASKNSSKIVKEQIATAYLNFGWIAEAAKTFNPYNYPDDELNDMFNKPRIGESMEDFKKRKGIKNEE